MNNIASKSDLELLRDHTMIAKTVCGSRLYGTNGPDSDTDYMYIYTCSTQRFLTHRYEKSYEVSTNPKSKNTKSDKDAKFYELQTFIAGCLSGQTYALDLLHTPQNLIEFEEPVWETIRNLKSKLITNNTRPFLGYCRKQAAKYSQKGEKFNELKTVIAEVSERLALDPRATVAEILGEDDGIFSGNFNLMHFTVRSRSPTDCYIDGPECSFPLSRKLSEVLPVLKTKFERFGTRTAAAADRNGLDLKAYYHALRVIWQMEEYLATGELVFPCARRSELLQVRAGEFGHEYIEKWIDEELLRVQAIPNTLPEPDHEFWNAWILDRYMLHGLREITNYMRTTEPV